MSKKQLIFTALTLVLCHCIYGQGKLADEGVSMSLFQFQGGVYTPSGDMANIYGNNAAIGFSYAYKTKNNFLLGADFNFMFGGDVKDASNLFRELRTSEGQIIGIEGEFVNVIVLQRGFASGVYAGKIFPIIGPNPNSGLVVKLGFNYLEHRTYIESREAEIPPLEGDFRKAYDRKRGGLALYQFIGYQNFSNNQFANFFVGFDFYQGFTQDLRTYNIDEMRFTDDKFLDFLFGIKLGWVLPVYKKLDNSFYVQ
jgi:hypothetical protein